MPKGRRKTKRLRGGSYTMPFFNKHTKESPRTLENVPMAIYQSWVSNRVPLKMKECMQNLMKSNPEFDHYLYSHERCLKFIKENYLHDVVEAYKSLKPGAYKSDLWRYCILYKLGGVYLDVKFYTTKSLASIIKTHPEVFIKDTVAEGTNDDVIRCKHGPGIYNGLLISPPNNPIFKECIDDIVKICRARDYKNSSLSITGPCLIGKVVKKYKGASFIKNNPFTFVGVDENGILMGNIKQHDRTIVKQYPEYRKEQSNSSIVHYTNSWQRKNVYRGGTRKQRGGGAVVFGLTNAAGFGSVAHFLTQAHSYAKKNGLKFSLVNDGWQYGNWNDYFKSFKDSTTEENAIKFKHATSIPRSTFKEHHESIKEFFVLNDDLLKSAEDFKKTIGAPYKAIYIRRGDKVSGAGAEMSAIDIPTLIKTTDIAPGNKLFVMTDDYSVVEEIKKILPEVNVFTLTPPESRGADIHSILKLDKDAMKKNANELFTSMQVFLGAEKGWVENRSNLGRFLKLASPSTMILYPGDSSNIDIPPTKEINPAYEYLSS